MSDIAAFLLARYDEGYEAARPRTVGQAGIDWMVCAGPSGKGDCHLRGLFNGQREDRWEKQNPSLDEVRAHEMTHASLKQIEAIRDIEAKREIVEDYQRCDELAAIKPDYQPRRNVLGDVLRLLAKPYSDHAEYDDGWRP